MKAANLSEIATLSASCDGECISGDKGHDNMAAFNGLEDNVERHEDDQVAAVKNELPQVRSTVHGENILRLNDQNAAASINGSDSLLMPVVENKLKYDQDSPAKNVIKNDDDDDDDYDNDDNGHQEDEEKEKGAEKEEEIEQGKEEQEQEEQIHEKEKQVEKVQESDDTSSRNSFHYRHINMTAAETDKISSMTMVSMTMAKNSTITGERVATGEHADVVENVDFDRNNFVVQAANHSVNNNGSTRKSVAAAEAEKTPSTSSSVATGEQVATDEDADVVKNVDFDSNNFIIQAANHSANDNATRTSTTVDEADKTPSATRPTSSVARREEVATDEHADVMENVDFNKNNFIVQAANHSVNNNGTRKSVAAAEAEKTPSTSSSVATGGQIATDEDADVVENVDVDSNNFIIQRANHSANNNANRTSETVAEADKTSSATRPTSSVARREEVATDEHADVMENVDFDNNNFIVQPAGNPANDTATKASVETDEVEEDLLDLPDDTEVADNSLPAVPSDNDEVNNLIRQHTDTDGKCRLLSCHQRVLNLWTFFLREPYYVVQYSFQNMAGLFASNVFRHDIIVTRKSALQGTASIPPRSRTLWSVLRVNQIVLGRKTISSFSRPSRALILTFNLSSSKM